MDDISKIISIAIPGQVPVKSSSLIFENLTWLTAREAVMYLRLPSLGALRNLVYRRKVPFSKLGRLLRFERRGLDRFLESSTMNRRISI